MISLAFLSIVATIALVPLETVAVKSYDLGNYGIVEVNSDGFELICALEYSLRKEFSENNLPKHHTDELWIDFVKLLRFRVDIGDEIEVQSCPQAIRDEFGGNTLDLADPMIPSLKDKLLSKPKMSAQARLKDVMERLERLKQN